MKTPLRASAQGPAPGSCRRNAAATQRRNGRTDRRAEETHRAKSLLRVGRQGGAGLSQDAGTRRSRPAQSYLGGGRLAVSSAEDQVLQREAGLLGPRVHAAPAQPRASARAREAGGENGGEVRGPKERDGPCAQSLGASAGSPRDPSVRRGSSSRGRCLEGTFSDATVTRGCSCLHVGRGAEHEARPTVCTKRRPPRPRTGLPC